MINSVNSLTNKVKYGGKQGKIVEDIRQKVMKYTYKHGWFIVKNYNVTIPTFWGGITTYMFVNANKISYVITKFQLSYWQGNSFHHFEAHLQLPQIFG